MRTDLFDFDLPPERIALRPGVPRDAARLLVVRPGGAPELEDRGVRDLPDLLNPGDALVVNDTQRDPGAAVRPAHRPRHRAEDRGDPDRAARRLALARLRPAGQEACSRATSSASATRARSASSASSTPRSKTRARAARSRCRSRFTGRCWTRRSPSAATCRCRPISPSRASPTTQDRADYQTLFARDEGSVAAPTAGLHFTDELAGAGSRRAASACTR